MNDSLTFFTEKVEIYRAKSNRTKKFFLQRLKIQFYDGIEKHDTAILESLKSKGLSLSGILKLHQALWTTVTDSYYGLSKTSAGLQGIGK